MNRESTIQTGMQSPDWVLPLLEGEELRLSALQGKRVLLFFWASW
jgi:peroxiredoxin